MMRALIAALTAALFVILATLPAHAQRVLPASAGDRLCGDGAGLIAHLEKEWGEDPAAIALDASGRMVRILVNPDTGTWSLLVTGPGGPTCLVQHGTAWQPVTPPADPGEPS